MLNLARQIFTSSQVPTYLSGLEGTSNFAVTCKSKGGDGQPAIAVPLGGGRGAGGGAFTKHVVVTIADLTACFITIDGGQTIFIDDSGQFYGCTSGSSGASGGQGGRDYSDLTPNIYKLGGNGAPGAVGGGGGGGGGSATETANGTDGTAAPFPGTTGGPGGTVGGGKGGNNAGVGENGNNRGGGGGGPSTGGDPGLGNTEASVVLDYWTSPTANAGIDQTIAHTASATVTGTPSAYHGETVWQTSGTGTFDNANALTAVYTPSDADKTAGSVVLTFRVPNGGAGTVADATDTMTLTIDPSPPETDTPSRAYKKRAVFKRTGTDRASGKRT